MNRVVGVFVFCLVVLALCLPARAQQVAGSLEGRVTDASGAVIPGASVKVKNQETGIERDTVTNEEGYYRFPFLPLGSYTLTVEMPGFRKTVQQNAAVDLNAIRTVDVRLQVAEVEQSVTVEAAPPTIDVVSGEVKTSIEGRAIDFLPLGTRNNFLQLATLFPGFQENPTSGQNNPTLSSGSSVSFNGTGTRGTSFQIDGINNDDSSENQNRQGVNVEAIEEFQIVSNNLMAEHGRSFGAVVLVVTKAGTNDYHSDFYYYHSNSALGANSFFRNASGADPVTGKDKAPRPVSLRHQYGFAGGGPIKKDKLHFFASFDNMDLPGQVDYVRNVLFPDERTPRVPDTDPYKAQNEAWVKMVLSYFPDVTPNAPEVSPRAYRTTTSRIYDEKDFSLRLDWNATDKDNAFFRFQASKQDYGSKDVIQNENALSNHEQYNFGTSWVHIFSPYTTGEFRLGVGRRDTRVTLAGGRDVPIIRWYGETGSSPIIGNAGAYPILRYQTDIQGVYNLTMTRGPHDLRLGTDTRRQHLNDLAENYGRGWWLFDPYGGKTAYQNFLEGRVTRYQKAFGPLYAGFRVFESNNYFQDLWKVSPTVSLNLGVRHEIVTAPSEVNGLLDFGYGNDLDNIEPRLGFAWSPAASSGFWSKITGGPNKFVLRGGYGMFHGRIFQSIFSQGGASVRTNPPNAVYITMPTGSYPVSAPLGPDYVFTPGDPGRRVTLSLVDSGLEMPYTQQWNLTIERQLPWQLSLSTSYIGNRGIGFVFYDWTNRPDFPTTAPNHSYNGTFAGVTFDKIAADPKATNPPAGTISVAQPRTDQRRPDARYQYITTVTNRSWTYYNGWQTKLNKRFSNGVTFLASYSWGNAIDTGSESTAVGSGDVNGAVSAILGPASMRGPSRFDVRHRFVATWGWQMPWLLQDKSILGQVVGGWNLAGALAFSSGTPVTALLGYDMNLDSYGGDRSNLLDASVLGMKIDRPYNNPQLDPSAFLEKTTDGKYVYYVKPGLANIGSLGRNTFRLDGTRNLNLGLFKTFKLPYENHQLQVRAEVFNATNTPQFGFPDLALTQGSTTLTSCDPATGRCLGGINPSFGRITSTANSPRSMQVGLKYMF